MVEKYIYSPKVQDYKKIYNLYKKIVDMEHKNPYSAPMSTEDQKQEAATDHAEAPDMYEVARRVSGFTQELLRDGANASDVAFALTTVAADMGLQVTGDPLQVIPVLMDAIAFQAKRRLDARNEDESGGDDVCSAELPSKGTTIH
jgi:hypothetical protein